MHWLHKIKLQPAQIIILGFLLLIFIGAVLLSLPVANRSGKPLPFLDAFFTSTSAVCVTGLIVVDTGLHFSLFGQIVIILLIQAGGLGVMTVMSFAFLLIRKRITLSERMILKEALNEFDLSGLVKIIIKILKVTFAAELLGSLLLATRFVPMFGLKGVYYSVFHSVSAFCNAGFDVFGPIGGEFKSLEMFANDPLVILTLGFLIISGGLGFVVISHICSPARIRQRQPLSRYAKLVLITTASLLIVGTLAVFLLERRNPDTIGSMSFGSQILNSFFESVTPRTAGYASFNQGGLLPATKYLVIILMFIGASPAGTGGGIKTTTFAILSIFTFSSVLGKRDVEIMERRIALDTVQRALTITLLSLFFVIAASFAMIGIEGPRGGMFTSENIIYEVVSAFGTVGLTTGITPFLSGASKIILIIGMYVGRVGLMTLVIALAIRSRKDNANIRYPEERFMVG